MPWSMEQKIFCVKTYYETKSFRIVQARFRRKFSFNQFPNRSQIFKLVKKFEAHGTCGDCRVAGSSPSGPPITICTPDNVSGVQESVGRSPSKSLRRRSQELGISVSSVRRMLVKDLQLYPYRIHIKHELTETDKEKRLREKFGKRLISRKAEVEWAPHSPDLNPPDFFLWGFLKDNIYQDNPLTIAALKAAITENIQTITQEECDRVINNFARRIQECLRQNGGHLEHVV